MPTSKSSTSNSPQYGALLRQLVANEDYKSLLDQTLAVLHRDGGHYTALAGYAVAIEDALTNYHEMRRELEELRRRLKVNG